MSTGEVINLTLSLRYSLACAENIDLHRASRGRFGTNSLWETLGRLALALLKRRIVTSSSKTLRYKVVSWQRDKFSSCSWFS